MAARGNFVTRSSDLPERRGVTACPCDDPVHCRVHGCTKRSVKPAAPQQDQPTQRSLTDLDMRLSRARAT